LGIDCIFDGEAGDDERVYSVGSRKPATVSIKSLLITVDSLLLQSSSTPTLASSTRSKCPKLSLYIITNLHLYNVESVYSSAICATPSSLLLRLRPL